MSCVCFGLTRSSLSSFFRLYLASLLTDALYSIWSCCSPSFYRQIPQVWFIIINLHLGLPLFLPPPDLPFLHCSCAVFSYKMSKIFQSASFNYWHNIWRYKCFNFLYLFSSNYFRILVQNNWKQTASPTLHLPQHIIDVPQNTCQTDGPVCQKNKDPN